MRLLKILSISCVIAKSAWKFRKPPPIGKWKLNLDGAIFTQHNLLGVVAILRDDSGSMIMAISRREAGTYIVEEIEALASLRELQMILHMGIPHVILEGDTLTVVEAIRSSCEEECSYSPLIREIQALLLHFHSFDVLHVTRQGNEAVHRLARNAQWMDDTIQWWHNPLDFILSNLEIDVEGLYAM
ncbi:hypothetical protein F2P56_022964 [Juglans regia]|uniref:Uncharacterized protein LOC108991412 n=2 Tax=Juglans regia TaxID=51240 RepID=A0A2I4EP73_JUGRE|nr:uncharacterized protein LOC108991412 [Juglans regia]KAF5458972.1 hypothetical protein F2P56_022964 [Juglans regia]